MTDHTDLARLGGNDHGAWRYPARAKRQSAFSKIRTFIGWSLIALIGLSVLILLSDAVHHYAWSCGAC